MPTYHQVDLCGCIRGCELMYAVYQSQAKYEYLLTYVHICKVWPHRSMLYIIQETNNMC